MPRYALSDLGQVSYGLETTPYTKEDPSDKYMGLITEDVDIPAGLNPMTMFKSGGTRRAPYIQSPDPREYAISVPILPIDANIPLEVAIGERTITDILDGTSVKVGERHTFTEADILQTLTLEHSQRDLGLKQWFIGCKGSLSISGSIGDAISMTLDLMATAHDYDKTAAVFPDLNIPRIDPFRFWMNQDVFWGTKQLCTLNSFDFSTDNGITPRHHGKGCNDTKDRQPYCVAEITGPDKYDMSMGIDIVDLDLYTAAVEDEELKDLVLPIKKGFSGDGTWNSGLEFTLKDCKIIEAQVPHPAEGVLEADIVLAPLAFELAILVPE